MIYLFHQGIRVCAHAQAGGTFNEIVIIIRDTGAAVSDVQASPIYNRGAVEAAARAGRSRDNGRKK